ncbi:MAG: hypothetical protein A2898_04950 [Candidatus Kerfeldbacteria bacterium RIFCSPLOWO2_01_FULL_48_11]|uniref:Uncharacterized protein n=1 Tax=Candidatus Kerfeldbacteria bacterium RIFCSPLOWO2_01_FULL_48_11 TaxID=1798543 RepID=A0A1G2B3W1_9BACT|nr:MAG: hypothetical protein UY34_C0039G0003 [Parcubacteria group bacterium GW2011_GWA2_48_9]KKW15665.1 MAG: hypothetical protein UY52_C0016G0042 [Parcubacteria group bacterium GW2011_GWC2_49_9]OGY82900.1 MAG: hypothetical protein A2898_04950 [Candidatus Kerfeldbacteria bacterium RIFCSPLOWO2_01_FULL_48_11]HCJ52796.1 hypothetical protein [Candidatus Kerfeldbacteria bacterium]
MTDVHIKSREPVVPGSTREYQVQIDDGPLSDWFPADHIQVGNNAITLSTTDSVHTIPIVGVVGTPA